MTTNKFVSELAAFQTPNATIRETKILLNAKQQLKAIIFASKPTNENFLITSNCCFV